MVSAMSSRHGTHDTRDGFGHPRLFPVDGRAADDYLTPPWLFERLGLTFDLDPAAPAGGVPWLPAAAHYSLLEDGLAQDWRGRVWLNPPYSNTAPWVDRMLEHRDGIALLPCSRAEWWARLWRRADAIVNLEDAAPDGSRFRFIRAGALTGVYLPVVLAAFGAASVEAAARVGPARYLAA